MGACCRIIMLLLLWNSISAQKKDSIHGAIIGVVWDSAFHYALPAASVVVYKNGKDSSMAAYSLADNTGKFMIGDLALNQPYRLLITFTGYQWFTKSFRLDAGSPMLDLHRVFLERSTKTLDEVVIRSVVPVRMNGDTLEFNADAFRLDSNAVVEDLIRRLPGMTVWGDGTITINGREISNVYVEGKPFFGGKPKIATQNLPKMAVDKIQVYSDVNMLNPLDSITSMNIKLKKEGKTGYFGKISAGYGTDERYALDGMLNLFTPRTQFGIGGAFNNINKEARNMDVLLENSSFKGGGAGMDYNSNFKQPGINRSRSAGFFYQHDFLDLPDKEHNNRLKGTGFVNNLRSDIDHNTITTQYFDKGSLLQKTNVNKNQTNYTTQDYNADYNLLTPERNTYLSAGFKLNDGSGSQSIQEAARDEAQQLQSSSQTLNSGKLKTSTLEVKAGYEKKYTTPDSYLRIPRDFKADVSFLKTQGDEEKHTALSFVSLTEPAQNKRIERKYQQHTDNAGGTLRLEYPNLKKLLLGRDDDKLFGINIGIKNYLSLKSDQMDNRVYDLDSTQAEFISNNYLTNISTYNTRENNTSISFKRDFRKHFSYRYDRNISIDFSLTGQYFNQRNNSEKAFQYFDRSYLKALPFVGFNYTKTQYGEFHRMFALNYATSREFPTPWQLVPLVDSTNIWYLQFGNTSLVPATTREININFENSSLRAKTFFRYQLTLSAGIVDNKISDSIVYDASGRVRHYFVNVDQSRYAGLEGQLSKAFKFENHQFQLLLNSATKLSGIPNYVNSKRLVSDILSSTNKLKVAYTFRDLSTIELGQQVALFRTGPDFSNTFYASTLSISQRITNRLNMGSDMSHDRNTATGAAPVRYTIWNANVVMRFLKGNQAEIKLAALDLLKQNTSVVNYGGVNSITTGTVNVLQQYFMLTLSFYPRHFGKTK